MSFIFWVLVFIVSLVVLIKSADFFIEGAERIGLFLKISPFIIGITIVAIGTSFPELASSVAAAIKGNTEIVTANAIGSNIANILLIVGFSAIVAKCLDIKRSLIDLDAPLLAISTVIFLIVAWDKKIVFWEGILLLLNFLVYLLYTVSQRKKEEPQTKSTLPSRIERREKEAEMILGLKDSQKLNFKVFAYLIGGIIGLTISSNYIIDSIINLSKIMKISPSLISVTALAVGTSLPELMVSVKAAAQKKYEIALGNIFGSNVFNALTVVGIPALIKSLSIDNLTFSVAFPFLIASTFLFVISGISRKIHIWEGLMYVLVYILFVIRLCTF